MKSLIKSKKLNYRRVTADNKSVLYQVRPKTTANQICTGKRKKWIILRGSRVCESAGLRKII